jgi:outer membrane protein assembly factor BamB
MTAPLLSPAHAAPCLTVGVRPVLRTGAKRTLFVALLCAAATASAADWPQWRGPERTGVSKESGLLSKWPDKGPPLLWTYRDAGLGFSSAAVVGGKLYTLGTRGDDEIVIALDATSGKELWTAKIGPIFTFKGNQWGDGPRGTPTIDGNHLYAIGGQGVLVCLDITASGKEVWRKDFVKDMGGEMMTEWGYSESPLVDGNVVVCAPGGDGGAIAALDKKTGAVVWRTKDLPHKATYGSAVVATLHGVRQYIHSSHIDDKKGGLLHGLSAKDGKVLWSAQLYEGFSYSACPTPLVVDKSTVYVTTLSQTVTGCHLFEIGPDFMVKDLYPKRVQKNMKNNHGGVVLVGGNIYGYSEGLGWVCHDLKTAKIKWDDRISLEGGSGAVIAAGDRLYLYSDEGEVVLLEPNDTEWTEHGRFKLPETSKLQPTLETSRSSKTWAHPVVANGRLYLRDHELVFCFDIRQ